MVTQHVPCYKIRPNSSLKPEKIKRFYYHLTDKEWGNRVMLAPVDGNKGNRAWNEPTNERTCVAPSIAHCLSAITYSRYDEPYNVYRTEKPVIAYWPYKVEDAIITRERWVITSESFIFIGQLSIESFLESRQIPEKFKNNSECGSKESLDLQRELLSFWKKALKSNSLGGLELNETRRHYKDV